MENRTKRKVEEMKIKQDKNRYCYVKYKIEDLKLIKNRQLPSNEDKLLKNLFLCCIGPFVVVKVNDNNTVMLAYRNGEVKGLYNLNQIKSY